MHDGNEDHRAESGGRQRKQEAAAENSKFGENPATNERTNEAKNNVGDATEAAAAGEFACEPSGDQSKQKPGDNPARPPFDHYGSMLKKSEKSEHAISRVDFRGLVKV